MLYSDSPSCRRRISNTRLLYQILCRLTRCAVLQSTKDDLSTQDDGAWNARSP